MAGQSDPGEIAHGADRALELGYQLFELPDRAHCFACYGVTTKVVWAMNGTAIHACTNCDARWLVGNAPREQGYEYGVLDSETRGYLAGRAQRHIGYLHRFSLRTGRLLDVGCGNGEFIDLASRRGWTATGVELLERAAMSTRAATGLDVRCGDISSDALFEPSSFDTVTLWGVLEHVPQPDLLLEAAVRLLAPGGLLLFETPSPIGIFQRAAVLSLALSGGRIHRPAAETIKAGHIAWFGPSAVAHTASRLGLTVLHIGGSKNSTRNLVARFRDLPLWQRLPVEAATAGLNTVAGPLGMANQLVAALSRAARPLHPADMLPSG